jgi:glycosyltransferase involved in cell wall biosynthesis
LLKTTIHNIDNEWLQIIVINIPNMSNHPIRVLHDLHWLTRGGIETWLMNLLRYFRNEQVHFDFAVCDSSYYDDEAKSYSSTIHTVSHPVHYFRYLNEMRNIMKTGNYDVLHCHRPEHASALMKIAQEEGIHCRIAHAHSSVWIRGKKNIFGTLRYWKYRLFGMNQCYQYATNLISCSSEAGQFFFGKRFRTDSITQVLFNGIVLEPFNVLSDKVQRQKLLDYYSLPKNSLIIGNVGSLDIPKNQQFLIHIFAELAKRNSRYILFIAGEGHLRQNLERLVNELNLQRRVIMPGNCSNVPELMTQLFDVFTLTSSFEGFGLVIVEATAAGLHTVCSDIITNDLLQHLPQKTTSLSLNDPVTVWVDALETGITKRSSPKEGVEIIRQTPFNIEYCAQHLLELYQNR